LFAADSGISADTSKLIEKLGGSVGLGRKELAHALGAAPGSAGAGRGSAGGVRGRGGPGSRGRTGRTPSSTTGRAGAAIVGGGTPRTGDTSQLGAAKARVAVPRVGLRKAAVEPERVYRPQRRPKGDTEKALLETEAEMAAEARAANAPLVRLAGGRRAIDPMAKSKLQDAYLDVVGGSGSPDNRKPIRVAKPRFERGGEMDPAVRVDAVCREIDERREFLEEMRGLGAADKYEERLGAEIQARLDELERLAPMVEMLGAASGGAGGGGGGRGSA